MTTEQKLEFNSKQLELMLMDLVADAIIDKLNAEASTTGNTIFVECPAENGLPAYSFVATISDIDIDYDSLKP